MLSLIIVSKLPSSDLLLKLGNASELYPLVWRFLAVLDPQVSLYFSRDLDSQLGERELAALMEFVRFPDASVSLLTNFHFNFNLLKM